MSKSKRYQLEKKIIVFLSSSLFAISGFCAGDVYAAAVFADGTGTNSTVAGVNNNASGENTNAVGYNNHAISDNSNAIGANNQALAEDSNAIGSKNNTYANESNAIGSGNITNGVGSNAIGKDNVANGLDSNAFGTANKANSDNSNAFGTGNLADGIGTSAFGYLNNVSGNESVAFGFTNTISAAEAVAMGRNNQVIATGGSAIGNNNQAMAMYSTAIGNDNYAIGENSSAIGLGNNITANDATALGNKNTASGISAGAVGISNTASGHNAQAFGYLNEATGQDSQAFGAQNKATERYASAFGHENEAKAYAGSALGVKNVATGNFASAVGYDNTASNYLANAIGTSNVASGAYANAYGVHNEANASYASAFGYGNIVSGEHGIASGYNNNISGNFASAFGTDNTVSNIRSAAVSGSGVYVGAFTDIEKAAAKLYAVGFRGANSGVYDMVYYRNKADNSYSGGKYNSTVNAYTLDTTYSVTVTRENGSYTTAVKSADGKVDLKSVSEEPSADLKGAVNVGFAIIGTTAVVNNLKVVSGSDTLIDASTFEGSFSPFSNNWDSYEGTSVTEAVNDNENGKVKVTVAGEIGTYGAGSIDVNMYNEAGELKDTKTVTAWNTTSNTVEFEPEASGTYYFEAVAKRTGVAKTYASSKYKSEGYMLPLKAAVLQLRTAEQSKIEVTWDAVPEATAYKVEYKKEGAAEFTFLEETTNLSAKTPSLTVGDVYIFRVTAVRSVDGQTKMSNEAQLKVAEHEQFTWKFSAFGQGVSVSNDNLSDKDKSKNGYSGGVNTDEGIVNVWSLDSKGKLVPASTDGVAFYYATIPTNKNFTLTATAKVNNWKYTNGQEGFGLMAADAVGNNGDSSVFWNNSYMASVTKVEYYSNVDEETGEATVSKTSGEKISMKLGIGSQEKIGVNKNNLSKLLDNDSDTVNNEFMTTMSTLETSKLGSAAGTFNLIGNYSNTDATFEGTTVENPITEVKLTIQKNNTGYFVSYTDAEGNTTTKKYYDTEALSQIDSDNVYVGMFASRTFDVTYSDISLTTIDPADDAPAEERPVEYKDIQVSVTSSSTASSEDYTFKGMSNADGHVVVTKGDDVIGETDVTANESFTIDTKLVAGDNKFVATFTPDENFKFGEYELPTSYDPIEVSKIVTYAYFTGDLIYVSADATKAVDEAKANETYSAKAQINSGKGTKDNPIDIYNAVAYARPGQKILLLDGDYKVANNLLIPFGIDGTDEKPIYLMSESSDSRVVLDFEGTTGEGITLCGNYWYIQNVDVTNSANGKDGIHVCGSHNVLDTVNTYKNGNTGIQISRYSSAQDKADWPAYNTIKNCTSHNNADAGYEDADGFAAKLTIGKGNVFVGCIAHHNADDGWDFFAKVETGNIPSVVIMNCVAYGNGYIESENGLIDAGNGNGFKMGGSSLPGSHVIINSVAFDNKAKGIDSNSCPDNVVVGCTSFNNENSNVALYTNDAKNTNYRTNGIISYRNAYVKVADNLKARGTQDTAKLYDATDYYWLSASGDAKEASTLLTDANFVTLNTNDVKVTRNANGTINMNGLGMLTADTRKALGVGIGADSLDKAPQLTSEGYALVIDALGYDEANRVLGLSLESAFILRDGAEGALTGDSNNIAVMVVLLLASMAVAGGAIVYSKKRKVVSK